MEYLLIIFIRFLLVCVVAAVAAAFGHICAKYRVPSYIFYPSLFLFAFTLVYLIIVIRNNF